MAVYLDTSAVVKLVVPEAESVPLFQFLTGAPERVSSVLLRLELERALRRDPEHRGYWRERAHALLPGIALVRLSEALLHMAASLEPPELGSLDAIHLATALSIPGLEGMVTYDRRLGAAAAAAGLRVWSPA